MGIFDMRVPSGESDHAPPLPGTSAPDSCNSERASLQAPAGGASSHASSDGSDTPQAISASAIGARSACRISGLRAAASPR